MPRAIVYMPAMVGGLDYQHLGFEQGMQQVLQLTKHLRAGTTNSTLYHSLIDVYQLHTGLPNPILSNTQPIPWCSSGWMTSIHQFLHTTNTKILISKLWTPHPCWRHDRNIMEDARRLLPTANLQAINNVRLFLRVTYLSEITDASGLCIRPDYLTHMQPLAGSTLQWPYQIAPLTANWNAWHDAIHTMYTKDNSTLLVNKLETWSADTSLHWNWEWHIDLDTHALYHKEGQHWTVRYPFCSRRTYLVYHTEAHQTAQCPLPTHTPTTPTLDTAKNQIRILLPIYLTITATTTPSTLQDDLLE